MCIRDSFSFEKLHNVDTMLGPEMKSTGEVLGLATVSYTHLAEPADTTRVSRSSKKRLKQRPKDGGKRQRFPRF